MLPRRFTDFIRRLWRAYLTVLAIVVNKLRLGSLFVALPSKAEEESQVTFESIGSAISFFASFLYEIHICSGYEYSSFYFGGRKGTAGAKIDGK